MKLKVYTKDGSNFTEQEFENIPQFEGDKGVFALKETLVAYQANARQGNASTLDYGSVSGTCRKPFKQKGGGRSRHGTMKSPIHRGGAVVFGPKPRDYSYSLNKKTRRLALKSALSAKAAEESILVIDGLKVEEIKTKPFAEFLKKIGVEGKAMVITENVDEAVIKSARNIPGVVTTSAKILSVYDIVNANQFIVDKAALAVIEEVFA